MLRPSKIFVPFHQLRHYIEARISELMVIKQPPQINHQPAFKRFITTTTQQQQQQQSIAFFSDLQRSLVQKAYLQQAPPLIKRNAANQKLLLKVIQHHFPVVKVFSAPSLHGRMWATAASGNGQQQFRTMMSSTSTSGGTCTASSFMTWGFPRTTAATVGFGRSPAFARQFSTTKSPSCVTLFQNTTNTTSGQSNVFAHISSRIFSPAGTKMNQPDLNEKQPKHASFHPASSVSSYDSDEESSCSSSKNRIFAFSTKGMGELVDQTENDDQECSANANLVRRESISSCRSKSSKQKLAKKNTSTTTINHEDLESIIRHDDLSSLYTTDNSMSSKSSTLSKRSNSRPHHSKHHRLKHPPDQQHHVRRQDDHPLTTVKNGGVTKKKLPSLSASISSTNTYLLITLDTLQFLDKRKEWSTQSLNTSFIDSIELMAYDYQVHINYVLKLLDSLQKQGKFRVVARKSELRIYFPVPPKSKQEAIEFLRSFNIVDSMLNYFTIVVEDRQFMLSPSDYNDDYFSFVPSSAATAHDANHSSTADATIGPDYFKDLQMFLDRTDYLIETSPAFRSS
ncbi:unnamed protein product [Mucor circinelloides]|uniref:Uncharacterized protein n=1 Tax=Mucor circinelloides f. circinelloides (strain 1006PhL) TaxID=1220926 RepID=S2K437_MUCC1|nr:hypothetical protein HMPREF1544_03069 [Mucor circinelloides 1006PhL]